MTSFEAWLPHVHLPGCPQKLALDAIRAAAREFCRETLVWQVTQDPLTVYVGEGEYAYEPPSKAEVVQPLYGFFSGAPIAVKSQQEIADLYPGTNWMTLTGTPRFIVHLSPRNANLVPIPDEKVVAALTIRVALKPQDTATEIDDLLFEDHRDAIAYGAKARLKLMSDQPFFSEKGASIDHKLFLDKVATERIRVMRGHGSGTLTARPRSKFA